MVFSYIEALREDPSGGLAGFPSDTMVTIMLYNNFPVISYFAQVNKCQIWMLALRGLLQRGIFMVAM